MDVIGSCWAKLVWGLHMLILASNTTQLLWLNDCIGNAFDNRTFYSHACSLNCPQCRLCHVCPVQSFWKLLGVSGLSLTFCVGITVSAVMIRLLRKAVSQMTHTFMG